MNTLRSAGRPSVLVVVALVTLAGCERTKSSNPLSPTIAGPIAGVTITVPKAVLPAVGQKIRDAEQPVSLVIENPQSNSPRPFKIAVQIAQDAGFTNLAYNQSGIAPASGGTTKLLLPQRLQPGRIYHWRTRAEDGANNSDWSAPQAFDLQINVVIGAPEPRTPIGGSRIAGLAPQLRVGNAASSGPHGPLVYRFEVSSNDTFTALVAQGYSDISSSGETSYTAPNMPAHDRTYYWRALTTDGTDAGAWSRTEQFRTAVLVAAPAPAPPVGGGGGGGTPLPPSSCASNSGPAIVKCVEAKYPAYLAAGVSSNQRAANMEFLRDRVIEAGICGGLDLAWNKKRGDGPHSHDALAWRTGGRDEVVDIGSAYDDTSRRLGLSWQIVAGPPGYDRYPRPNCGS